MKFVEVNEIPKVERKTRNKICLFLDEFMTSNKRFARVEFKEGEYKRLENAYKVLWTAARRDGYPVTVYRRKGEIFLARKDM